MKTKPDLGTCEMCNKRPATIVQEDDFDPERNGWDDSRWRLCLPCLPKWAKTRDRLRLERAAPDLLAAAKLAIAFVEGEEVETDVGDALNKVLDALKQAVAKAGGGR